ncbi:hypothetical protein H8E88_01155 [candidate division KSB1 bacterium]|nr:hypothetical protein [candidate division KSB1 bacterium]
MNYFIFLTVEGDTFQPSSLCIEIVEPDIENCQMIGISKGLDSKSAFENLVRENDYLLETTFDEIFCYPLERDYKKRRRTFSLSSLKNNQIST